MTEVGAQIVIKGIAWRAALVLVLFAELLWAEQPTPAMVPSAATRGVSTAGAAADASRSQTGQVSDGVAKPTAVDSATVTASVDSAATQFVETCAGCHTIGGGVSRGPDLVSVAGWPETQLEQTVKSMERKVGPLTAQQIARLVAMLKDANVQQRIAQAKSKLAGDTNQTRVPADSLLGGALFFGHTGLSNGGMACSSCHHFHGEGGDLGPDLTRFGDAVELEPLASTIGRAAFPVMRAAYETHPIEAEEARHIAAFMKQAKATRQASPFANTTLAGFGVGLGTFALVFVLIRTRPSGVRTRLVQRATKR